MIYSASTLTLPINGFLRLTKVVSQRSPRNCLGFAQVWPRGCLEVHQRLSRGCSAHKLAQKAQKFLKVRGCSKGPEVPEGQRLPRCCPYYRHLNSNNDLAKKSFDKCCVIIFEKTHHLQWHGIRGTFL